MFKFWVFDSRQEYEMQTIQMPFKVLESLTYLIKVSRQVIKLFLPFCLPWFNTKMGQVEQIAPS